MDAYTSSFPTPYSTAETNSLAPSFTVRKAGMQDLGGIAEVLTHSFHSCQGWGWFLYPFLKVGIYEDLRSRMCSDRAYYACLVAVESSTGKIVGTVELLLGTPDGWIPKQHQSTYISNLAVSASYRRQGIAQRLLRSCEELTASWGFREIYLHVLDNNVQAQKLYQRCGYHSCRVEPSLTAWLLKQPKRVLLGKSVV